MIPWFISSVVWSHFCRRWINVSSIILWKFVLRTLKMAAQPERITVASIYCLFYRMEWLWQHLSALSFIVILYVSVYTYLDIFTSLIQCLSFYFHLLQGVKWKRSRDRNVCEWLKWWVSKEYFLLATLGYILAFGCPRYHQLLA